MLYVFTTCALNFVPCAKLLAASVKEHMPDAKFVFVLTDEQPTDFRLEDEGFDEVLYIEDFADQFDNPRGWAFGHSIMELATAVKPFTAAKLMERDDCEGVMFFDPDCVLFDDMAEMRAELKKTSVLLTPHASLMHENSDWIFFEKNPLKVGGFNLGFFAFQNNETGRAVASWWRYRLKDYCLLDPDQGLFIDQKWMDLLPNYIDDYKCMRQPVYNVARWNTFQREITKKDDVYLVDGAPIQFVHFSGFYKIGPYVRGLYDRSSEPLIEDLSVLQELSLWYSECLAEARSHPVYAAPWQFGLYKNGEEIPEKDRRLYKASADLQRRYPDPFATDALDSYWLYCRKQARRENETRIKDLEPSSIMINRSVQAHNTLLRQQNEAFEKQFAAMMAEIADLRESIEQYNADTMRVLMPILSMLRHVPRERVLSVFSELLETGEFDPNAYLEQNPDIVESGVDPLEHFIMFGLAEGRMLSATERDLFVAQHMGKILEVFQPEPSAAGVQAEDAVPAPEKA